MTRKSIIMLIVLLTGVYLLGNWLVSFYDRDEPRYAQPAKEMLFADNWKGWIVPQYNGDPFFHKPPWCYWQIAMAYKIFGINEFSARFFSSLWTAITAGIIAWYIGRKFSPVAGITSALSFATSLLVIGLSKQAITDATLNLFSIICIFCLWSMIDKHRSFKLQFLFWSCMGLAILIKGPMIFVTLAGLTIIWLILDKSGRWILQTGFWWGIALTFLIGLPWYIITDYLSGGAMVERFILYDLIDRIRMPLESHRGFPGFYLVTGLISLWPWSAMLVPVCIFAWQNRTRRNVKFLIAWIVGPTIILEIIRTQMVHYWLTVLPAWSILLGLAMDHWFNEPDFTFWKKWTRPVLSALVIVWILLALGILVAQKFLFGGFLLGPIILCGVLFLSAAMLIIIERKKHPLKFFMGITLTTILIVVTLSVFVLPVFEKHKIGKILAETMQSISEKNQINTLTETLPSSQPSHNGKSNHPQFALIGWQQPSTIFYLNDGIHPITIASPDKLASLLSKPNTIVAVSDKYFEQTQNALLTLPDQHFTINTLTGYDYVRGKKITFKIYHSSLNE